MAVPKRFKFKKKKKNIIYKKQLNSLKNSKIFLKFNKFIFKYVILIKFFYLFVYYSFYIF